MELQQANIDIMQQSTIVCPESMVTLSRQCCRVPSSDELTHSMLNEM